MTRNSEHGRASMVHDLTIRRPVEGNKQLNKTLRDLNKLRVSSGLEDMAIKEAGELGATVLQAYKLQQLLDRSTRTLEITTEDLARELELTLEYMHTPPRIPGALSVGVTGLMRVGKANRGLAVTFESPEFEEETAAVAEYLGSTFGVDDVDSLHGTPHISVSKGGRDRGMQWSSDDVTKLESQLPDTLVLHRPKAVIGYTRRSRTN